MLTIRHVVVFFLYDMRVLLFLFCFCSASDAFPWGAGHGTLRDTRK